MYIYIYMFVYTTIYPYQHIIIDKATFRQTHLPVVYSTWTCFCFSGFKKKHNVGIAIINHPPNHHFDGWYKLSNMGVPMTLL